jgi:hypothetical protein
VVILPDNDDVGHAHMTVVAASLRGVTKPRGVTKSIRVLELPGLPPKGDIIDWANSGGTVEQLHALIEHAPHWLPLAGTDGNSILVNQAQHEDKSDGGHDHTETRGHGRVLPPPNEPMAVARVFANECLFDGELTLRHWRGGWWMWKKSHWIEVNDTAVRSIAYPSTRNTFRTEMSMIGLRHNAKFSIFLMR